MIPVVIVATLAVLAVAATLVLLARRSDDDLARTWSQLVSPSGRQFQETVDSQIAMQERILSTRQELAAEAASSGTPLEAARLAQLERDCRDQHRTLLVLRRMLSALKTR